MVQDAMVITKFADGWCLLEALAGSGLDVQTAFWARLSDEEKWRLYLASPVVDEKGSTFVYGIIGPILRGATDWSINPFDVVAIGVSDSMAQAAAEIVKPRAATNPKSYRGLTAFDDSKLGRYYVEGAYIYPPWRPGVTLNLG